MLKSAGRNLEIILVSFDRDQQIWMENFRSMPWLALPFEGRERAVRTNLLIKVNS